MITPHGPATLDMLAVALGGGARTIFSEDMQHGLVIDGTLRIVDPFR